MVNQQHYFEQSLSVLEPLCVINLCINFLVELAHFLGRLANVVVQPLAVEKLDARVNAYLEAWVVKQGCPESLEVHVQHEVQLLQSGTQGH